MPKTQIRQKKTVSIHAPARGATREHRPRHRQAHVSIHAPARGATIAAKAEAEARTSFNPRAREGRDSSGLQAGNFAAQVSIHAPARGATGMHIAAPASNGVSIHAPARGATDGPTIARGQSLTFQSTRPRGARLQFYALASHRTNCTIPQITSR